MNEKFAVIECYSGTLLDLYTTLEDATEALREVSIDGGHYAIFKKFKSDK